MTDGEIDSLSSQSRKLSIRQSMDLVFTDDGPVVCALVISEKTLDKDNCGNGRMTGMCHCDRAYSLKQGSVDMGLVK